MPLINNQIESLYNGVSEQAAEHRQNTQVKEMINAYPTIDRGLLKRNPTEQLPLSSSISYSQNMWTYEYDRGLSGDSEEKYVLSINNDGLEIINILNGDVYKEAAGLTYEGDAKNYLFPFSGINGYSSTTVKDTTFIVNKNVTPRMKDTGAAAGSAVQVYEAQLGLVSTQLYAPYYIPAAGFPIADGYTTIVVDGVSVLIESIHEIQYPIGFTESGLQSYGVYTANLIEALESALDNTVYKISMDANFILYIKRIDDNPIVVTYDIEFKYKDGTVEPLGVPTDFIASLTYNDYADVIEETSSEFLEDAYIWIKSSNSASAYTYYATIIDSLSNTLTVSTSDTTSEGAAAALAIAISADANFTATSVNSVVKVSCLAGRTIKSIESGDSWGNQASFGWHYKVQFTTDLPKNLGYADAIVNIIGSSDTSVSYWLKYEDAQWVETIDPRALTEIDITYMPHILVRNSDGTFTFKTYDLWADRLIGDDESNKLPSFLASDTDGSPSIRDIFFFKNRLGFITDRNVVMSEVGNYGNFWRTTAATLLDSDPIDTTVDTTKAIKLEYATYLEDSVMLFSDKAQFKLAGGKILSPSSVQISQTSAYEINKVIRPIYLNDKIFFCVKRGNNTAVMQYQVKTGSVASEAIDITAHVQTYIPSNTIRLSGSTINNMLFLSVDNSDTIFVYKYYDSGEARVQSAWFKWRFNGIVYSAFSLGKNLNIMINRNNAIEATDWVLGTGIWESDKLWDSSKLWISSPDDLISQDQFEVMAIAPRDYRSIEFLDDLGSDNETQINTDINIGEWVPSFKGQKNIRGHLKFKTAQISSETDSDFELIIIDNSRNTIRTVKSKYTVNRKPMVYGDAKNIEIGIRNHTNIGFRINTVSYEGNFNSRSIRT